MEFSKKFKLMKKTGIPAEVFHFSKSEEFLHPHISFFYFFPWSK
jgi:hypothetical protein